MNQIMNAENVESAPTENQPVKDVVGESGIPAEPVVEETNLNADGTPKERGAEPTEAEKRIKRLLAERKAANEEAARLAQEVAYLKGVAEGRKPADAVKSSNETPQEDVAPVPPSVDKFDKYEDFEAAKDQYLVNKAKFEIRQDEKKKAEERKKGEARSSWSSKLVAAAQKKEDFMAVVSNPAFVQSDPVTFLIMESEIGTDLAYYLGTHLDEAARLNTLPPHRAAMEIGKLEAKLLTPKTEEPKKVVSQAPSPISTVSSKGAVEVDEQELPIEEFVKRRNAKQFGVKK